MVFGGSGFPAMHCPWVGSIEIAFCGYCVTRCAEWAAESLSDVTESVPCSHNVSQQCPPASSLLTDLSQWLATHIQFNCRFLTHFNSLGYDQQVTTWVRKSDMTFPIHLHTVQACGVCAVCVCGVLAESL